MEIQGNKIMAKPGYMLVRQSDNHVAGDKVILGYTYYLNGEKLDIPLLENPEDYTEIPEISDLVKEETEEGIVISWKCPIEGYFGSVSCQDVNYNTVKIAVIRFRYSNDDQIAIMLNRDRKPEVYIRMQEWRTVAAFIAKSIV